MSPYTDSLSPRWHITWSPTSSSSMKPYGQTLRKECWAVRACSPELLFQLSSAKTAQTIGELFTWDWREQQKNSPIYLEDFI